MKKWIALTTAVLTVAGAFVLMTQDQQTADTKASTPTVVAFDAGPGTMSIGVLNS